MTLTLFNFPQSTCSQKVRLCLWHKGLPFEDRIIEHKKREHLSDWYLAMNPNGVVPTMTDGDAVIIDSSVIMEYLEEAYPDTPSLSPSDPVRRAHMRKWLRYFEEVPTPAIRVPSFNQYIAKRYAHLSDAEYREMADSHPIRKQFYQHMQKEGGFDERETTDALDRLRQTCDRMEKGLTDSGGPWLMGENLTLADFCVTPTIDRMNDLGLSESWAHCPKVTAWYEAIQALPEFQKTYYAGTRLSEIADMKAA